MKVLTLLSLERKGGRVRRFVELVDGLSARGSEVVLLSPSDYQGTGSVLTEPVALPTGRLRTARMMLSRRCVERIATAIRRHKPDVVFTFGLANGGPLCQAARRLGVPSVLFIRGMELVLANKSLLSSRLPVVRTAVRASYQGLFRIYARSVLANADAVVFQHETQHQAYVEEHLIPSAFSGIILLLPNNSNPSWVQDSTPYRSQHEPLTIIAARLEWNKGFRQAFEAFRMVRASVPNARLVVLGEGPDGNGIRRHGCEVGGVEFPGHIDNINEYLGSARVLLHPSIHEFGSPNVILEAAAMGVPMIVSDQSIHTVGTRPYVYPSHDHRALAKLWLRAITDDAFHAWLCRESRDLADRYRFDWVGKALGILRTVGGTQPRESQSPGMDASFRLNGGRDDPGIHFG